MIPNIKEKIEMSIMRAGAGPEAARRRSSRCEGGDGPSGEGWHYARLHWGARRLDLKPGVHWSGNMHNSK
jgi:hypothetical protein